MKFVIPFLLAAVLPAAALAQPQAAAQSPSGAQTQAADGSSVPSIAIPKPRREIRQCYSRGDSKVLFFVVDAKTEEEARAIMETLPLAKEHLTDHQYIPVGPLMPLKALNPGAFQ